MAIRFFDMFAGIGGFRTGLTKIGGFECVGHCEIDKYANAAYCAMYKTGGEQYYEDAREIDPKNLPNFDLLCAGFPCQAFSVAGKRLGFSDTRGTLFFDVARILEVKRPAFVFLENVQGLLSHDSGETLKTIYSVLVEMGYNIEWCVLNSKYFGVPQQRRRLYIIGYLDGRCTGQIFPVECCNGANLKEIIPGSQGQRVYDITGVSCTLCAGGGGMGGKTGLYFIDMNSDPVITSQARCITARQDSGVSNRRGEHSGVLVEDAPRAVLTPDREKVRQKGRRMKEPDEEMFTITAQDRHGVYHKGRIRKLMPIECWRLQGKFLLSYNDCPEIRELYKGFSMLDFSRTHSMAQRYEAGKEFKELLISNYDLYERERSKPQQLTLFSCYGDDKYDYEKVLKECIVQCRIQN